MVKRASNLPELSEPQCRVIFACRDQWRSVREIAIAARWRVVGRYLTPQRSLELLYRKDAIDIRETVHGVFYRATARGLSALRQAQERQRWTP